MQPDPLVCPRPEHAGARITRNGSYGPYGRQRFKCQPVDGPAHTFSVYDRPPGIDADPDADLGQDGVARLKWFRHSATDIARALLHIGRGATYRQAAIGIGGTRPGRAPGAINGQLVANWVTTFGPLVTAEAEPPRWPAVIGVASFALRRGPDRDDLLVQLATADHPTLLHVRVTERGAGDAWDGFFERYGGRPDIIIVEPGSRPAAAVRRRWPDHPPLLVRASCAAPDVEAHISVDAVVGSMRQCRDTLFRRLAGRQAHFTNLDQLGQLVALMRLDLNGAADQAAYVRRILAGRA